MFLDTRYLLFSSFSGQQMFIQVRMRANPPPQSGVQCLGQARTLRFLCFYSVICAAMFSDTLCKAQLESSFAFKFCWFFDPCLPGWLPFRFMFGSIFSPFWTPLGSILHHFGGFWRPLGVPGGVLGGGRVFRCLLEARMVAKWRPVGSQNL